jgi:hypothetical protein
MIRVKLYMAFRLIVDAGRDKSAEFEVEEITPQEAPEVSGLQAQLNLKAVRGLTKVTFRFKVSFVRTYTMEALTIEHEGGR